MNERQETQLTVLHYLERFVEIFRRYGFVISKYGFGRTRLDDGASDLINFINNNRQNDAFPPQTNLFIKDLSNHLVKLVIVSDSILRQVQQQCMADRTAEFLDRTAILELQDIVREGYDRYVSERLVLKYVGAPISVLNTVILSSISKSIAKCC